MDVQEAYEHIRQHLSIDAGSFFSSGESISLGAGKLYSGVCFPIYDPGSGVFLTAAGAVYVLTHECDVDQANDRIFNEDVLVCPLTEFEAFVKSYRELLTADQLRNFLTNLARRQVSRVIYLPPLPPRLPYGALMYLNNITNTHVSAFTNNGAESIGAVTGPGLRVIDQSIENHLLRPKAERLALMR